MKNKMPNAMSRKSSGKQITMKMKGIPLGGFAPIKGKKGKR